MARLCKISLALIVVTWRGSFKAFGRKARKCPERSNFWVIWNMCCDSRVERRSSLSFREINTRILGLLKSILAFAKRSKWSRGSKKKRRGKEEWAGKWAEGFIPGERSSFSPRSRRISLFFPFREKTFLEDFSTLTMESSSA